MEVVYVNAVLYRFVNAPLADRYPVLTEKAWVRFTPEPPSSVKKKFSFCEGLTSSEV